jgi:hypothetical protein
MKPDMTRPACHLALCLGLAAALPGTAQDTGKTDFPLKLAEGFVATVSYTAEDEGLTAGWEPGTPKTPSKAPGESVLLRSSASNPGPAFAFKNRRDWEYLCECIAVDPEGVMSIRQTWQRVAQVRQGADGKAYEDDTAKPSVLPTREVPPESGLVGQSLVYQVTPERKVRSVTGAEAVAGVFLSQDRWGLPPDTPENRKQWAEHFSSYPLLLLWTPAAFLPGKPVARGDTWGVESRCGAASCPADASRTVQWSFSDATDGIAHLRGQARGASPHETRCVDASGSDAGLLVEKADETLTIDLSIVTATGLILQCMGEKARLGSVVWEPLPGQPQVAARVATAWPIKSTWTWKVKTVVGKTRPAGAPYRSRGVP